MSTFSFELPTGIVFGPGCVKELANELQKLGVSRPLVVTDIGIVKAGILDKVIAFLPKTIPVGSSNENVDIKFFIIKFPLYNYYLFFS